MKLSNIAILLLCLVLPGVALAQSASPGISFIDFQKTFPRPKEALKNKEALLIKEFKEKGLEWPAKYIYFRSFKYDSEFEVWVKYKRNEPYRLFKTYRVCALAGSLGPKRIQGDYQVPEGFYYINAFNPKSMYHLSLGLNYPNVSDKILSDSYTPGGDIFIHGSCVTTGCIPITDSRIEEVYILAAHARNEGQDFIPVHIFPIQFKNARSVDYLNKYLKTYQEYSPLVTELKEVYDYFEITKELPVILVNNKGRYVIAGKELPRKEEENVFIAPPKEPRKRAYINEASLAKVVDKLPQYPGGQQGFQNFLNAASEEMTQYLAEGRDKDYMMIEFVIDSTGKPLYAKVLSGGNEELNEKLELLFEGMPYWEPATYKENQVSMKLKQGIMVQKSNNTVARPENSTEGN